jgi:hypothetical protein
MIPNTTQMKPDFLSKKLKMPYHLRRFDKHDSRFYFEVEDRRSTQGKEVIIPYISITSLADKLIPGGKQIDMWRASLGKEAEKYMMERAEFGTLFHYLAFLPLIGKSRIHKNGFDFDWLYKRKRGQKWTNFELMVPPEWRWAAPRWEWSFNRGLLAWFEFVRTTINEVIAVEVTLRSKDGKYAVTLDLVHTSEYYGKEHLCLTDIKSFFYAPAESKVKGFYPINQFQLEGGKKAWNENFPDMPITHIFNWSPTQWRKKPGWTWKNQTKNQFNNIIVKDKKTERAFDLLLDYAKTQGFNQPPSKIVHVTGKIEKVWDFDWKDHIIELNIN